MTAIIGTLIEAIDEIRIHKLRVTLALLGIGLAIAVMTGAIAMGQQVAQANREFNDKMNGRDATLSLELGAPDPARQDAAFAAAEDFIRRHEIEYATRVANTYLDFTSDVGPIGGTELYLVDADYAVIHRLEPVVGDWFGDGDVQRLAPALVVNEAFLRTAGLPKDLSHQPDGLRIASGPAKGQTFVVIGVVPDQWEMDGPRAYVLWDALATAFAGNGKMTEELGLWPQYRLWLSPGDATIALSAAPQEIQAALGPGGYVSAWLSSGGMYDPTEGVRDIVFWIGIAVLVLGAVSLVNLQLVTVQQRVREIGIRRSFGAASSRVFTAIVLESVVGTFLAGVVGVALAIILLDRVPVLELMGLPVQDMPPFPMGTAVMGIVAATGVGALAGLLPGFVATRIRPIEAMRA